MKCLWTNHERTHNFFAGFHYFIVALGVIIGGCWVLYTFDVLNQKEKAENELTEIHNRIKNTESTTIKINTTELKTEIGMIIEVEIKNNGNTKLTFKLDDSSLMIYKIKSLGDQIGAETNYSPKYYASIAKLGTSSENEALTEQIVLINAVKTLSYLVTLKEKGIYYITFSADYTENKDIEKNIRWFASKYVEIK